jgi:hypothetical protein
LDLAIDAQNLRHLLLELGIAAFQILDDRSHETGSDGTGSLLVDSPFAVV